MVSKSILIQYSDLQQEIKYLSKEIDKLKNEKVKLEARKKHDMVRGSEKNYPYIERSIHIEGLTNIDEMTLNRKLNDSLRKLESRYENLLQVTNETLDFIESIDDSHMRMIITYRIIENYSWSKVADSIGGGNTEDGVRKAFTRFMEKE